MREALAMRPSKSASALLLPSLSLRSFVGLPLPDTPSSQVSRGITSPTLVILCQLLSCGGYLPQVRERAGAVVGVVNDTTRQ